MVQDVFSSSACFGWTLKLCILLGAVTTKLAVLVSPKYLHLSSFRGDTSVSWVNVIVLREKMLKCLIIWLLDRIKLLAYPIKHFEILPRRGMWEMISRGSTSEIWNTSTQIRARLFMHWWNTCIWIGNLWWWSWLTLSKMTIIVR
jgi:hypothetical protein